jgi:hypothetical protein
VGLMGVEYYLVDHEQKKIFYLGKNVHLRWFSLKWNINPVIVVSVITMIDNLREACADMTIADRIYRLATICREVYQTNPGAVLVPDTVIDTDDDWWNTYEKDW